MELLSKAKKEQSFKPKQPTPEDSQVMPAVNQQVKSVLIRYNTRQDNDNPLPWRVLIFDPTTPNIRDDFFADKVVIEVASATTQNEIAEGIIKWHISAQGYVHNIGDTFYITATIK